MPDTADHAGKVLRAYRSLARAVTAGDELQAVLSSLVGTLSAPVAVVDLRGNIVAAAPARWPWPVDDIIRWRPDAPPSELAEEFGIAPVELAGEVVALLCAHSAEAEDELLAFAAALIAVDLGRRQAVLTGRRELAAQIIEDVIRGAVSEREAERRLGAFGVSLEQPSRVIVGEADVPLERLRAFPWNLQLLMSELQEPYVRTLLGHQVVMIAPAVEAVTAMARLMHEHLSHLSRHARVGVGHAHRGASGLRLSYFEARDAASQGDGVHLHRALDIANLLVLAGDELQLRELGVEALRPLLDYDREHNAQLVETLHVYLRENGAPRAAADALYVHRNTVAYRLSLIETLTERDLSDFATRVHYWLALAILHNEPADAATDGP